jgi:hypothetical protein
MIFNCKEIGHDHLGDCAKFMGSRWIQLMKNGMKIYSVVHLTITLVRFLRLRKKWRERDKLSTEDVDSKIMEVRSLLLKLVLGCVNSSLFVSIFASSIPFATCFFNRAFGGGRSIHGMMLGFFFSNSIYFESKGRWSEISLYVLA